MLRFSFFNRVTHFSNRWGRCASTQHKFLRDVCLGIERNPSNQRIPVLLAPRGFRKTTVANEVAHRSNGKIYHLTQMEVCQQCRKYDKPWGPLDELQSILDLIERLIATKPQLECIILDGLLPKHLMPRTVRNFLSCYLPRSLSGKQAVLLSANEGFAYCDEDIATVKSLIELQPFPAPTPTELTTALKHALANRKTILGAFINVPMCITPEHITQDLVDTVLAKLPIRHGFSMRVWGLLLEHPKSATCTVPAVLETLHDQRFLYLVARLLDVYVGELDPMIGLLESDEMSIVDINKLLRLLKLKQDAKASVPGRLALFSLLLRGRCDDAETDRYLFRGTCVRWKIAQIAGETATRELDLLG